ncbi:hypothetical protein M0G43_08285 [Subsaxibacter sp. CAU 1640]|uniref:hypothetical protein n=1 Tax=Subsaxibacter sp. CAU 1640 TaxID=2933271 RepID=UPI0020048311|nr:hypothetical protein [Subsaxibacter sp. CAU 1640]MCK7590567.1 hypothetical protein [Subsaxibacter sp. CAU 1640]
MRTQLIGLVFLGLTSLTQAQKSIETDVETTSVDLKDVIISTNSKYMNKVYDENSSEVVKNFEQIIAGYDIKSNEIYSDEYDNYSVNFKTSSSSKMNVTYDKDGTILTSKEQYDDILLPYSIRQSLVKDYPGWKLHSNSYKVVYSHRNDIKKTYKIQARKDGERKNLKINLDGNMAIVSVDYD